MGPSLGVLADIVPARLTRRGVCAVVLADRGGDRWIGDRQPASGAPGPVVLRTGPAPAPAVRGRPVSPSGPPPPRRPPDGDRRSAIGNIRPAPQRGATPVCARLREPVPSGPPGRGAPEVTLRPCRLPWVLIQLSSGRTWLPL